MNQDERRRFLIRALLRERAEYGEADLPSEAAAQRRLLRGLLNIRPPRPAAADFL